MTGHGVVISNQNILHVDFLKGLGGELPTVAKLPSFGARFQADASPMALASSTMLKSPNDVARFSTPKELARRTRLTDAAEIKQEGGSVLRTLSAQIFPPCRSMMRLTMDRPTPEPSKREPGSRLNGLNK
jgi:hypothetical protein